jgi:hypothetical protein
MCIEESESFSVSGRFPTTSRAPFNNLYILVFPLKIHKIICRLLAMVVSLYCDLTSIYDNFKLAARTICNFTQSAAETSRAPFNDLYILVFPLKIHKIICRLLAMVVALYCDLTSIYDNFKLAASTNCRKALLNLRSIKLP